MRNIFKGKGHSKEVAGSSSSNPTTEQPKRRRLDDRLAPDATGYVFENQMWDSGLLSAIREDLQPGLFKAKMNTLQKKSDGFVCEKEVPEGEFGPFGVHKRFKELGWEAVLKCYDGTKRMVYMDEIEEWVSTLKLDMGRAPSQMKLVGTVGDTEVTMSFASLNQIAKFDSKQGNRYVYPRLDDLYFKPEMHPQWSNMVNALFLPGRNPEKWSREDLTLKAKLIHLIMQSNVIPRRGDKSEVRFPEIPVLYALMHGGPLISFRYLVMNNIWMSRDSHGRKMVPHCRLIAALLRKAGVISGETVGLPKRFMPFTLKTLGSNWVFSATPTHLTLANYHQTRKWRVPKGGDGLDSGEERNSEGSEGSEEEEHDEGVRDMGQGQRTVEEIRAERNVRVGMGDSRPLEPDWAYQGSLENVIRQARPSSYDRWGGISQIEYDHMTRMGASQERMLKSVYDRQEEWQRANAYAQQREINHHYEDDCRRRMHDQWHAGQEVVSDPPLIDYRTLPPYDGTVSYPMPPLHHSEWLHPRPDEPQQPEQIQDQGGLEFGAFQNTFNSIFGPPHSRYY